MVSCYNLLVSLDAFQLPAFLYFNKKVKKTQNNKTTYENYPIRFSGSIFGFIFTVFTCVTILAYSSHLIIEGIILGNLNRYSSITSPNLYDQADGVYDLNHFKFNGSREAKDLYQNSFDISFQIDFFKHREDLPDVFTGN